MVLAEGHQLSSSGVKRRCSAAMRRKAGHALSLIVGAYLVAVVPAAFWSPVQLLFSSPSYLQPSRRPQVWASSSTSAAAPFCGPTPEAALPGRLCSQRRLPLPMAASSVAAPMGWMDPRRWTGATPSPAERLSPRDWTRMYRTLGVGEDASKEQVLKATTRLRRKYAKNEEALERVEAANLWIMTQIVSRSEDARRQRQQANRMRELGDSPRRLFQKYIAGYIPPSIRQMIESPSTKHFRWTSGLLGVFALMALCVPTQAPNFVGLGAVSSMGLIYQRNRPEPVKDEMGNVGRVSKVNPKEMIATIVVTLFGVVTGFLLSLGIGYLVDAPFQVVFATTICLVLWPLTLYFKVYQCFD
mmetsp:Transcript_10024/g.28276  ORF Transcript_10024/g.28276 Transcript_10024/m.28276 type:complete len:357 (+) Transcript_10024:52-1122(+)